MTHDLSSPVNLCVIKHNNGFLPDAERQTVKIFDDSLQVDGFCSGEPVIIGIPVNDTKAVESELLAGREVLLIDGLEQLDEVQKNIPYRAPRLYQLNKRKAKIAKFKSGL